MSAMYDVQDLRATIVPKSDQLNAEQLMLGDLTVTVSDVRIGSDDQPVIVHYDGDDGRPYKPCKTMRKVLIFAWGEDGTQWVGKAMTLYNDPAVRFGGLSVGGIRISHLSHIEREIALSLTATKGKKAAHTIKPLKSAKPPTLADVLAAVENATTPHDLSAAGALALKLSTKADKESARAAYAARLKALRTPAKTSPPPAKTLDTYREDIDNAADESTAALIIDEARDVLSASEFAELSASFKWQRVLTGRPTL